MESKGTLDGVWLNEDEDGKPARLKMMGEYYSTFKREMLEGFQPDDLVEIQYHVEKGKFKTIDSIAYVKDIETCIMHVRDIETQEKPKGRNLYVEEARININRILDNLEEKINGA